jgi:hypothetical protein
MKYVKREHMVVSILMFLWVFCLMPGTMVPSAVADSPDDRTLRRFALIIGSNNGGDDRVRLRYAQSDAEAMSRILMGLGGLSYRDNIVLLEPDRQSIEKAFERIQTMFQLAQREGIRFELLFYFSGHSDEQGLLLGGEHFSYRDIRESIDALNADVRIAILDSCSSGAFTRSKGGKRQAPFLVDSSSQVSGYAFLTSASADEAAQESDRIGGSFFTHYLISGLRGAADGSRDGRVSLNEAYHYAFNETLERTESTRGGAQHPNYDIQLAGSGDLVLTDLRGTSALLILSPELAGRLFIRDSEGRLVAEINKPAGRSMSVGMEPGIYDLALERNYELRKGKITIAEGAESLLKTDALELVETEETVSRGHPAGTGKEEEITVVPINFSLVPGLSTNHGVSGRIKNKLSLIALLDWSDELAGLELAGIGAVRWGNVKGVQLAGTFNYSGGGVTGFQGSGTANITQKDFKGAQMAGTLNYTGEDLAGFQGSGAANIVKGHIAGFQGSGVVNYAGSIKGVQAAVINVATGRSDGLQAGVVNVTTGRVKGLQAGVVNYGGKVRGVQIGIVNIAKEMEGAPIGIINYVGNGILAPTVWVSDTSRYNVGLKMGSRSFYSILGMGLNPVGSEEWFSTLFGLGSHIDFDPMWLEIDMVHHDLHNRHGDRNWKNEDTDTLAKLRTVFGYRVFDQLSIYGGPTLNYMDSDVRDDIIGTDFLKIWEKTRGDTNKKLWPGFMLGLQFEPRWGKLNSH